MFYKKYQEVRNQRPTHGKRATNRPCMDIAYILIASKIDLNR